MKKRVIKGICIGAAVLLAGAACFFQYQNSKFVYNDEYADGNQAGNLYNNGLFVEYENKIYFSNFNDDGTLYVMNSDFSAIKKLSNDKISHINVAGEHIIYSRINNKKTNTTSSRLQFTPVGIYRCELDGDNLEALDTSVMGMVHQYGNNVYFQYYTENETYAFNTMDIKGDNMEMVTSEAIYPASIVNGTLYYNGFSKDHNIYTMDLTTKESELILEGNYYNVLVNGDYLFMLSIDSNYSIVRSSLDGSNLETLISDRVYTYNITPDNRYLYYQIDNNSTNGIHMYDLTTNKDYTLLTGNFKNINLTNDYVFFTDTNETTMYTAKLGDTSINQFNPPKEEE